MSAKSSLLLDIQILRAFAILTVLFCHLSLTATVLQQLPGALLPPLWVGVELFFVISGFIVTKTVCEGSMAALPFAIRRAFRLWPAMFFFVGLSGIAAYLAYALMPDNLFAKQSLIVSPRKFASEELSVLFGYFINRNGSSFYMNGAMWSLSVEFQFYAVFFVLLVMLALGEFSAKTKKSAILIVAIAVYAISLWHRATIATGGLLGDVPRFVPYLTSFKFDFMALGVLGYFISISRLKLPAYGPALTALALAASLVIATVCEHPLTGGPKPWLDGWGLTVMGWSFLLAVLLASRGDAFRGRDTVWYRFFTWVGDRSYSIYLLHYPIMALIWIGLVRLYPAAFASEMSYGLIQATLVIVLSFALADFSYRHIELPGSRLARRVIVAIGWDEPRRASVPDATSVPHA
ncbi:MULTISPECIES: acyltransferase [unclassified Bosea (in: a-proteobacteria)]|uniref:acyltransferase family protein n=1 Tax=unclassified Bosea (in: a-proteobacteria) TaxID=2653178 RepID=UPI0013597168|nr:MULTISPECIES: acyltransferase [unclassified Bosea (in: a-proteobacteria)]